MPILCPTQLAPQPSGAGPSAHSDTGDTETARAASGGAGGVAGGVLGRR